MTPSEEQALGALAEAVAKCQSVREAELAGQLADAKDSAAYWRSIFASSNTIADELRANLAAIRARLGPIHTATADVAKAIDKGPASRVETALITLRELWDALDYEIDQQDRRWIIQSESGTDLWTDETGPLTRGQVMAWNRPPGVTIRIVDAATKEPDAALLENRNGQPATA